jgi:Flp pilus assembly protein TadG
MRSIGKKGAALTEFALLLPLLLLILCGMIEFGVLFYNKQVLTNACREGTRAGIIPTSAGTVDQALIKQIVKAYCNKDLQDTQDTWKLKKLYPPYYIELTDANVPDAVVDASNDLSVTVTISFPLFFSQIIGISNTSVTARTVMRMEPVI